MRTLNVRLAAILLVIVAVLFGGVYWLHGYQVKRNAGVFLEAAKRAEADAADAAEKKDTRRQRNRDRGGHAMPLLLRAIDAERH